MKVVEEGDNFINMLDELIELIDENVDILTDIEYYLESEKEDTVMTDLTKNDLVDMAHEVADHARIKKAESHFVKRFFENI